MVKKVFEVVCWWDDDVNETTRMYVVANNENEVDEKMSAYALDLKNKGCATLNWLDCSGYKVEFDWVIC